MSIYFVQSIFLEATGGDDVGEYDASAAHEASERLFSYLADVASLFSQTDGRSTDIFSADGESVVPLSTGPKAVKGSLQSPIQISCVFFLLFMRNNFALMPWAKEREREPSVMLVVIRPVRRLVSVTHVAVAFWYMHGFGMQFISRLSSISSKQIDHRFQDRE